MGLEITLLIVGLVVGALIGVACFGLGISYDTLLRHRERRFEVEQENKILTHEIALLRGEQMRPTGRSGTSPSSPRVRTPEIRTPRPARLHVEQGPIGYDEHGDPSDEGALDPLDDGPTVTHD